jgi:hypothetical protein
LEIKEYLNKMYIWEGKPGNKLRYLGRKTAEKHCNPGE